MLRAQRLHWCWCWYSSHQLLPQSQPVCDLQKSHGTSHGHRNTAHRGHRPCQAAGPETQRRHRQSTGKGRTLSMTTILPKSWGQGRGCSGTMMDARQASCWSSSCLGHDVRLSSLTSRAKSGRGCLRGRCGRRYSDSLHACLGVGGKESCSRGCCQTTSVGKMTTLHQIRAEGWG
jgi:hypothetical protein